MKITLSSRSVVFESTGQPVEETFLPFTLPIKDWEIEPGGVPKRDITLWLDLNFQEQVSSPLGDILSFSVPAMAGLDGEDLRRLNQCIHDGRFKSRLPGGELFYALKVKLQANRTTEIKTVRPMGMNRRSRLYGPITEVDFSEALPPGVGPHLGVNGYMLPSKMMGDGLTHLLYLGDGNFQLISYSEPLKPVSESLVAGPLGKALNKNIADYRPPSNYLSSILAELPPDAIFKTTRPPGRALIRPIIKPPEFETLRGKVSILDATTAGVRFHVLGNSAVHAAPLFCRLKNRPPSTSPETSPEVKGQERASYLDMVGAELARIDNPKMLEDIPEDNPAFSKPGLKAYVSHIGGKFAATQTDLLERLREQDAGDAAKEAAAAKLKVAILKGLGEPDANNFTVL